MITRVFAIAFVLLAVALVWIAGSLFIEGFPFTLVMLPGLALLGVAVALLMWLARYAVSRRRQ